MAKVAKEAAAAVPSPMGEVMAVHRANSRTVAEAMALECRVLQPPEPPKREGLKPLLCSAQRCAHWWWTKAPTAGDPGLGRCGLIGQR